MTEPLYGEKGLLTISACNSNTRERFVMMQIYDAENNKMLTVNIEAKDFGMAITGLGFVACRIEPGAHDD